MLQSGERQVAPTRDGIRRDHVARYEFAARRLDIGARVLDLACGIGYGTQLLAQSAARVLGIDKDKETLKYAAEHYAHKGAEYRQLNLGWMKPMEGFDAAVCFEAIEHIEAPELMLQALSNSVETLIASVPNESVFPWKGYAFHLRHYTQTEFEDLLNRTGWHVTEWWGQAGTESEVNRNCKGRTLIAVAKRATETLPNSAPKHVSIVGLGPSSAQYVSICRGLGGRHRYCDETWSINAFGDVLACDRIFHMDDVRIQQIRADAAPESNIAVMLDWMRTHPGPIITSRAHDDYPGLVEFPLEDVVNSCPNGYFNSTAAYAVAYAIWLGVEKISLFGCDFTYPNAHDAEKGRACVEFWLGVASERGIKIVVPKTTSLLDALNTQTERFYGYDTLELSVTREGERIAIKRTERAELPTADEIEDRYDHGRHPNDLVEGE